uniref:Thioredoxin domain-containing protein n=1 Tax=Aplanochytrium stocchinoi TaxID=215587 RepID=A0A7S3PLA2_9STRA|mmetsp:Transcript_4731/g.5964  ORF Transcript_4731/g.5964 Transcript_4731/m.5964 type:complete len:275 (+) Transcript_4731:108-932(+)|eukprot:CAMPEP_0204828938 /NCGR_PEP_ID=MMETSP1346-20131115/6907_1 /ASSEMBLY_ACC=CAM_ASM_000771 /TAXON_ID=215587 /ORGANISM="Aplanochytrium stocchinoi, Strain GSBS06" /LENGTH=274 /DNA_ID=CAMNT_0051958355 /DNA_START=117 /DNA_END=941 /DNA_ORIENTATION=+
MPVRTSEIHEVPLGTKCPEFELTTVDTGKKITRESLVKETEDFKGLCVMFLCNHCPIVGHIRASLALVAEMYQEQGIAFVAIMPNELSISAMNNPTEMCAEIKKFNYTFPYCFDGDKQKVSRDIGVAVTPDFFVYNKDLELVYRGAFDATRPSEQGFFTPGEVLWTVKDFKVGAPPDGLYLRSALDALVSEEKDKISKIQQFPAEGCSVKWIPGEQEPSWSVSEYNYPEAVKYHHAWNRKYYLWKFFYNIVYSFLGIFGYERPPIGNELNKGGI